MSTQHLIHTKVKSRKRKRKKKKNRDIILNYQPPAQSDRQDTTNTQKSEHTANQRQSPFNQSDFTQNPDQPPNGLPDCPWAGFPGGIGAPGVVGHPGIPPPALMAGIAPSPACCWGFPAKNGWPPGPCVDGYIARFESIAGYAAAEAPGNPMDASGGCCVTCGASENGCAM